jgi:hypothetical protein
VFTKNPEGLLFTFFVNQIQAVPQPVPDEYTTKYRVSIYG